jgi:hypothetical protein
VNGYTSWKDHVLAHTPDANYVDPLAPNVDPTATGGPSIIASMMVPPGHLK